MATQTELRDLLREAKPEWGPGNLAGAETKLAAINVYTVEALAEALRGRLNDRLRDADQKTFDPDTVRALRKCVSVRKPARKSAAKPTANATEVEAPAATEVAKVQPTERIPEMTTTPPERLETPIVGTAFTSSLPLSMQAGAEAEAVKEETLDGARGGSTHAPLARDSAALPTANVTAATAPEAIDAAKVHRTERRPEMAEAPREKLKVPILEKAAKEEKLHARNAEEPSTEAEHAASNSHPAEWRSTVTRPEVCTPTALLRDLLREANPEWGPGSLASAEAKLSSINIGTMEALAEALRSRLNDRLRDAGQKTFHADTVRALRKCVSVQETFDSLGIPAERIGSLQAASNLARRWERLGEMRPCEIRAEFTALGLLVSPSSSDQELLDHLRLIALWDTLPQDELHVECDARNISYNASRLANKNEQRKHLKDRLLLSVAADALQERDVPAHRLCSIEAGLRLCGQFDRYRVLDEDQLRKECADRGLPTTSQSRRQELHALLRDAALWDELPAAELYLECQRLGVLNENHQLVGPEDEQCKSLRDALLFKACAAAFRERRIYTAEFETFATCATIARRWDEIDGLDSAGLWIFYMDVSNGLVPEGLPQPKIRDRLKTAVKLIERPLEEVQTFCRQSGVNPNEMEGDKLALVARLLQKLWLEPTRPHEPPRGQPPPRREQSPDQQKHSPRGRMDPKQPSSTKEQTYRHRPPSPLQHRPQSSPPEDLDALREQAAEYFDLLQLSYSSTMEDVKGAYKAMARKFYPEKNKGNEQQCAEQWMQMGVAYEFFAKNLKYL